MCDRDTFVLTGELDHTNVMRYSGDLDALTVAVTDALAPALRSQNPGLKPRAPLADTRAGADDLEALVRRVGREQALAAYDEALAIYEELRARDPLSFGMELAATQGNRGHLLGDMGRYAEALAAYDEVLAIHQDMASCGPAAPCPYLALAHNNRGTVLGDMGRRPEALEAYDEALVLYRRLAQDEPETYAENLARTLCNKAELLGAEAAGADGLLTEAAEAAARTPDPLITSEIKTRLSAVRHDVSLQRAWDNKRKWETEFRSFLRQRRGPVTLPAHPATGVRAPGFLQCLRKWASYTPIPFFRADDSSPSGGGFFLQWHDWGLCIDPGFDFGRVFRRAGWAPSDIDAILCTHHHIDHTGDMLALLTCLYEMNQDGSHTMDFLLSGSVFAAHADLLSFLPGVGRLQPLRPGEPVILSDTVRLLPVPADHKDLTGRKDGAIGFLLELTDDTDSCRVGFTGDTALFEGVPEVLAETDLLVVNVGSIYPSDLGLDSPDGCGHLGINGTIKYLRRLKEVHGELKPLLLLSEWGEELGPFRRQLCEVIAERGGVDPRRVWPAEEMAKVALWPGDAHPVCSSCNTRIAQVVKSLPGSDLAYHCEEGAH